MRSLSAVVLGAGVAGLAASLALARDGHHVTLVERDQVEAGDPFAALSWERDGIPHFLQPHFFIPRGRAELRSSFPDVFDSLLDAGATNLDLRPKISGPLRPEDEALAYFGARRPIVEWAFRKAILAEPGVTVLSGVRAAGYDGERGAVPRLRAVLTSAGPLAADVVVDAMGRRSPSWDWIESLGGMRMVERATECGIIYYSRYYRIRDGASLPDGPWLPTPRSDLGYGSFSSSLADSRTFAAILQVPPGDPDFKVLRHRAAFDAAVETMPALYSWTNSDTAEPITDVMPMGSLQNTLRTPREGLPSAIGVIGIGDSICHTDPALAHGLAFALIHARALAAALAGHPDDLADAGAAFDAATRPEMEERFAYASSIDEARSRRWAGEPVDVGHRDGGAYALFTFLAGGAAALADGDVFRAVVRRNTFLDRLGVLDGDDELQTRIERIYAGIVAEGRPRPGPSREELLAVVTNALQAGTAGMSAPRAR